MRYDYVRGELDEASVLPDPIEQLGVWLEDAAAAGVVESTAMCVSTVGGGGKPSSRFVLLRGLDHRGLTFFTNYESRKGQEIEANEHVCAAFWWAALERQVRIEGVAERVSREESAAYFASRPRESQIASAASPQSAVIQGREVLVERVSRLAEALPEEVPPPTNWGGYRIVPRVIEFWQGRAARLHDRLRFTKILDSDWLLERLAP